MPLETPDSNSVRFQKTVLVIVRSETVLTRMDELCSALFASMAIQCLFTVPKPISRFDRGVEAAIRERGCIYVPWGEVLSRTFDLAISASPNGNFELIDAPLVVMQHGPALSKEEALSDTVRLMERLRTRVRPTVLACPTDPEELDAIPQSIRTEIVGDPVFDSMVAYANLRQSFREDLDVGGHRLVTLSSTWGPDCLISRHPRLVRTLLETLPSNRFRVALILHPYVWQAHGEWQIRAWLRRELQAGLLLIPHRSGWQATILASDLIIGDHGSVTHYAASAGIPTVRPSEVGAAPTIRTPIARQTESVAVTVASEQEIVRRALLAEPVGMPHARTDAFSCVGKSLQQLQRLFHELLDLEIAETPPERCIPIAPPIPIASPTGLYRTVTTCSSAGGMALMATDSYPASLPCEDFAYDGRLIADGTTADTHAIAQADVLVVAAEATDEDEAVRVARTHLDRHPNLKTVIVMVATGWVLLGRKGGCTAATAATDLESIPTTGAILFMVEHGIESALIGNGEQRTPIRIRPL